MGRLLLVRHGESLWNRDAIVQGQAGPGLSRLGERQAEATAQWIAEEVRERHGDDLEQVRFVSSDLPRCLETAAPIAALLGREPILDRALRERHFGSWQGVRRADLVTRDPDVWARFARREDVVAEVGGESSRQLVARVVPALRRHAAAATTAVVVTHGGPVWYGVHALLGIPESVLGDVANASVATLDVRIDVGTTGHVNGSVRDSVGDSTRDSVRNSVRDSVSGSVSGSVGDSVSGSVESSVDRGQDVRLVGWNAVGHMPPALRTTWQRSARVASVDGTDGPAAARLRDRVR